LKYFYFFTNFGWCKGLIADISMFQEGMMEPAEDATVVPANKKSIPYMLNKVVHLPRHMRQVHRWDEFRSGRVLSQNMTSIWKKPAVREKNSKKERAQKKDVSHKKLSSCCKKDSQPFKANPQFWKRFKDVETTIGLC
jgi:hypothetical protein